ncbi:Wzz/FepE/Etk N-terminal domain-containing protein [Armatimonas sp.]|uniref:GumC family protein n=1 Tax=Armatimonas sp. TaxID=1872638 RepID=UPI00286C870E|nr:Wzz/FepE/Etk N-terminal domain-containing protein [Armatimonas sp.]
MDERVLPPPITLRELVRLVARRWLLALSVFLLTVAATYLLTKRITPVYESRSRVLLESGSGSGSAGGLGSLLGLVTGGNSSGNASLDTEMEKIETQEFYKKLRVQAGLGDMGLDEIQFRLQLSGGRGGQVLVFNARGTTPEQAQRIANTAAVLYIELARTDAKNRILLDRDRLKTAAALARQEKNRTEQALERFNKGMAASEPTAYFKGRAERTIGVRRDLEEAKKQEAVLIAQLAAQQSQLTELPKEIINGYTLTKNPVIDGYRAEIVALKAQRKVKLLDYQVDSPEVQTIDEEISAKEKAIQEAQKTAFSEGSKSVGRNPDFSTTQSEILRNRTSLISLRKTIGETENLLATLEKEQSKLADKQFQYLTLRTSFEAAAEADKTAQSGLIAATIKEATGQPYIRVIDWGRKPDFPLSPKPLLNTILSVFLGLFLGIGLALLAEYFSNKPQPEVFSFEEPLPALPMVGGVPLLGTAPVGGSDHLSARDEDRLREIGYWLAHRESGDPVPVRLLLGVRSDDRAATLAGQLAKVLGRDGVRVAVEDVDSQSIGTLPALLANLSAAGNDLILLSGPVVWNVRTVGPLEKIAGGLVLVASPDTPVEESVSRARRLLTNGYTPRFHGVVAAEELPALSAMDLKMETNP